MQTHQYSKIVKPGGPHYSNIALNNQSQAIYGQKV